MLRTSNRTGMRSQRAFTLMELVVVIAIMSALIGIASVTISRSVRQARLQDAARELQGELGQIRNRARTQQRTVVTQITGSSIMAFYDMNSDRAFDAAVDYIDVNNNGAYDAGVDTDGVFLQHTYRNGIQFAVTSDPGLNVVAPLTTFRFNTAGSIDDDSRIITVSLNTEPLRRYRIMLYMTGSTRVLRSDDAGATWPTRPW